MRKVVLFIASSLDGFIARKDGAIDWLPGSGVEGSEEVDDVEEHGYDELMERTDSLIMGRKTYEPVLTFGDWPYDGRECYVATSKKLKEDKNVQFVEDAVEVLTRLRKEKGKDIWLVGGGGLNGSLLNAGLVDEIIVTVIPVVIGEGIKLFENVDKDAKLKLVDSKSFKSGMVQLRYQVA